MRLEFKIKIHLNNNKCRFVSKKKPKKINKSSGDRTALKTFLQLNRVRAGLDNNEFK